MSAALSHWRVLDLTDRPNQLCARVFADFGAEVIKIEPPEGDPSREQEPFFYWLIIIAAISAEFILLWVAFTGV